MLNEIFEKVDGLNLEKSEPCMLSPFCSAFIEKNPVMTNELFPVIESLLNDSKFQSKIMELYTRSLINERKQTLNEMEDRKLDPNVISFYSPILESINEKLKIQTFEVLLDAVEKRANQSYNIEIYNNCYTNIHGTDGVSYIVDNYKYYNLGSLLFNEFKSIKSRTEMLGNIYSQEVLYEYKKIDVDLDEIDQQFIKYKLLSLDDNMSLISDKDNQIIQDNRLEKYFWVSVPRKLLSTIIQLKEKSFISEIAFKIDYISDLLIAMEEMDFGSCLKMKVSSLPSISKFYDLNNFDNSLWVHHNVEKKSLVFEELLDDFEIIGENIVTQVVHLEYFSENDSFFISHIDHEYIIYNLEEYEEKLQSPQKKGHKKVKTFKIDNSKIPFFYKVANEYFLFQVLDTYMQNKALISEYFEKI